MRNGNRTIKVKKSDLIDTVKKHRENHIKEYADAVNAYKLEAIDQLQKLTLDAKSNKLGLKLKLIEPIDSTKNYDKIIQMFEWEIEDTVELTQDEFREYVLDENPHIQAARVSNQMYSGKWK